jgi:anti-sigma factor RsiW
MDHCGQYQAQLLDFLYDLLEGDEHRSLREHLAHCPACQAALAQAQGQQRLLAVAAKMEFPAVRFEPPREHLRLAQRPAATPPARRAWGRWAAAAVILLTLGGLGAAGGWSWHDYASARTAADGYRAQVAQAHQERSEALAKLNAAPQERAEKERQIQEAAARQQLKVVVSGPETVQPGAANQFQIQTRNPNTNQPVPGRLTVRVTGDDKKVLLEQKDVASNGTYNLDLPPNLPVKPDARLSLEVLARRDGGPEEAVHEELPLAAPLYATHLATDKPLYRPGETVYFRSLTLDRFSMKPPGEDFHLLFKLRKPGGEEAVVASGLSQVARDADQKVITGPDGKPLHGLGAGEFRIGPNDPGGEYTLVISEAENRFPPQERKFLVNRYEKQNLNKELEWSRKSYGPGDEVTANCKVARAEGGPVACQVQATVTVDGRNYGADGKLGGLLPPLKTDTEGQVAVKFRLPETMERGLATLSVSFFDGANNESISKPIPVVLNKLLVDFYPEGGDLVAGVPNRVYFQVRSTLDKPADLRGKVVDGEGRVVADGVETFNLPDQPGANQGLGRFEFTPEAGKTYELKIESPVAIEGKHELPKVQPEGVVLSVPGGVIGTTEPLRVVVRSPGRDRSLLVGAYCRGRLMDHQPLTVQKGESGSVELHPAEDVGGVYRITVFEQRAGDGNRQDLRPVAERLVYRLPGRQLHFDIRPDRKQYVPGDQAKVALTATDEASRAVPAVALVAVVDKSLLTLADEKTARSMPTHFYLTTEVRRPEDLEHADFLLSPHPKAREALDLLLGTQGWRRFAEQDPVKFRRDQREEAERLLVSIGQSSPRTTDLLQHDLERVNKDYEQEVAQQRDRLSRATEAERAALSAPAFTRATKRLADYDDFVNKMRGETLPLLGLALLLTAFVALLVGVIRNSLRAVPLGLGALACSVVLFVVVVAEVGNNQAGPAGGMAITQGEATRTGAALAEEPRAPAPGDDRDVNAAEFDNLKRPEGAIQDKAEGLGAPPLPQRAPGAPPPAVAGGGMKAPRMEMRPLAAKKGEKGGAADEKGMGGFGARERVDEEKQVQQQRAIAPAADIMPPREEPAGEAKDRMPGFLKRPGPRGGAMPMGPFGGAAAEKPAPPPAPFVVREYAHKHEPVRAGEMRSDFTETLYWNPVLVLRDGKGEVSFGLSDAVTGYQVAVMGHTLDGRIGAATGMLEARLPLSVDPKVPVEVGSTDKVDIPVSLANNTADPREVALRLTATGMTLRDGGKAEERVTVPAEGRVRRVFRLQPGVVDGPATLELQAEAAPFAADSIRRTFPVVPDGFPVVVSKSDVLEKVSQQEFVLPEAWVKGTLQLKAEVYPSTLADLQKGLEALLREPGGCFEQTSSSNYPNLLILDYLKETDQAKPEVQQRALAMLDRGYRMLAGFECPYTGAGRHGYEWFGAPNAAHEALTAYGLLEFRDMSRVYKVDPDMLERTRQFLMAQRDGQGGFKRNPSAVDTFGRAPQDITNAYIIWALTESGKEDDVTRELNALAEQAKTSKDPYFLALVGNSLLNRDRSAEGVEVLKSVAGLQKDAGHLDAARTSITGSGGRDLQIETTALAVLGWLKANRPAEFTNPLQKAVRWIGQQRGGYGGFGSTQSTILALKALIAFAKANKKTAEGGELRLFVNDEAVEHLSFAAGVQDALTLALREPEKRLRPGKNTVRVEITGDKNVFPCTVAVSYRTLMPPSADNAAVRLSTALDRQTAGEGDTVHLTVTVENARAEGQGMAVAIVGLPAGLTLPEDLKQLKDYARLRNNGTERGLISHFETRGRELVLYWRDLAPKQKIEVPLDLIARVPGEYRGPASRSYLYYNADTKYWVEPLQVTIKAKE